MEHEIIIPLSGTLTSEQIGEVQKNLHVGLQLADRITVCLGAINKTDRAGFHCLVNYYLDAYRQNKRVRFINCREPMLVDLIHWCELDHVFTIN